MSVFTPRSGVRLVTTEEEAAELRDAHFPMPDTFACVHGCVVFNNGYDISWGTPAAARPHVDDLLAFLLLNSADSTLDLHISSKTKGDRVSYTGSVALKGSTSQHPVASTTYEHEQPYSNEADIADALLVTLLSAVHRVLDRRHVAA